MRDVRPQSVADFAVRAASHGIIGADQEMETQIGIQHSGGEVYAYFIDKLNVNCAHANCRGLG